MARKKSAAKKAREAAEHARAVAGDFTEAKEPVATEPGVSSNSDTSEEEDEYGELLTENVEQLIQKVMGMLKSDPKKLLDPEVKFFDDTDAPVSKKSGDKPMYLKDYHRMNLLSGEYKNDSDNEYGTVDGEKPYLVTQKEERDQLLSDIKNAFKDGDDDDGFLKKKENPEPADAAPRLPDPNANTEEFLCSFLNNQAWIPKKDDKAIDLDAIDREDEQEFEDAVEDFERAYNFRYEDPNSAEIVSYARTQATLRRGKTNARKRVREKKHAIKEQEKLEIEQALQKKKVAKMNKVIDRLAKIKETVGDDVLDEVIERVFGDCLLKDDFDDSDWDGKMSEIFNEQYYDSEMVKPDCGSDDKFMVEFRESSDLGGDADKDDVGEDEGKSDSEEAEEKPRSKSKKEKLKEKKSAKKEKEFLKEKAQKIVEANATKIKEEVEEERGRLRTDEIKFKYREVSPESFGLTTRDIFLADDEQLNQYFSIKKFAPYKPKEQALKDKRKYTKHKQMKQWRYMTFKDTNGPKRQKGEKDDEIWIRVEDVPPKTKKQKTKK
ncbi:Krr1-domain-containing protein [Metschnikowia bicuspidata]|uniref:Krr1-domain-containing protein n=1 Tax=Metschnikowia bicuspidata TaxID=27322 RepID=A0A4P9ZD86_9ASCO|nr:Krr1-domain-containing protein [Metschnikowia bicuspidata]